jgi:hypothetical protein
MHQCKVAVTGMFSWKAEKKKWRIVFRGKDSSVVTWSENGKEM